MKVLVVDDHPIIIALLSDLLKSNFPNVEIFKETRIENAARITSQIKPDILILDVSVGEKDTMDYFVEIRNAVPNAYFIIYSMHNIPGYISFFKDAGAHAYVLKEDAPTKLKEVIYGIISGETFFPVLARKRLAPHELNQLVFSKEEIHFLFALVKTSGDSRLDSELAINPGEVLALRKKLLLKCGATNTQELIALTKKHNWTER